MKKECYGISINLDYDDKLTNFSRKLLRDYYMQDHEESPQESFARAAVAFSYDFQNKKYDLSLAQRIYNYAAKGWFMFSSPILSNAPVPGGTELGLPISCFLSYVDDSLEGLIDHSNELRWMSVKGGGVGGHWSKVRSNSSISPGPIPFLKSADSDMTAYRQGKTRKGSYAAYMDVSHPDIIEFLSIRLPTGGDVNRKCFNLNNAVNVTDEFMEAVSKGEKWNLIDPNDKTIRDTVDARELWQRILKVRFRTGEPYINFISEANKHLPQYQKDLGLKIHGSNLCLTGDTKIDVLIDNVPNAQVSLEEVVDLFHEGKEIFVLSYNIDTKEIEYKEITDAGLISKSAEVLEIIDEETGKKIVCTPDHKVYTVNRGYVKAKDLKEDDELVFS
jgi:ribonucleoside-diphosphate reductase alpha chain